MNKNIIYVTSWEISYKKSFEIELDKGDCMIAICQTEFLGTYLPAVSYIPEYSLSYQGEDLDYFGKQTFDKTFSIWPKNSEESYLIPNTVQNMNILTSTVIDQIKETGNVPHLLF